MIIIHVVTKVIKWTVIVVAYLLVGLAKLVTILLVLLFLTGRAGVRRLLETKDRRAEADEPEEYDLGYPAHVGRPSASRHGVSRDAFDARWQRERDLLVAERRARRREAGVGRVVSGRSDADYHP